MMLMCLAAPQQDSAGEIPPYNKDATEPRDVYKLDDGILSQYVKRWIRLYGCVIVRIGYKHKCRSCYLT